MSKRVLIVVAHPDDEVLGCGGTIAKLVKKGWECYTLFLGEGITSRDPFRDPEKRKNELKQLREQATKANKILGVKEVFFENFPDNRFDGVELLDIVKRIEGYIDEIKPRLIFTHWEGDLNQDHRLVAEAVKIATRPVPNCSVKAVYTCEVLSSSEWNFSKVFTPNVYVDISETLKVKLHPH
jgi:LmbE family N-acetylglucosaminyl deacetylase